MKSLLFACTMNSIRSPMAETLARAMLGVDVKVESCGVYEGMIDPFVTTVLSEIGLADPDHNPKTLEEIDLDDYRVVVALSGTAHEVLKERRPDTQFWPVENPSESQGSREMILDSYRSTRDSLQRMIVEAFGRG